MLKPLSKLSVLAMFLVFSTTALAEIKSKNVEYKSEDVVMKGYIAWDDSIQGKRPAVLVVHEWWGHDDYARKRADMLAELGYTAMSIDMYGDGKQANHPDDAGKFAGEVRKNMPVAEKRFNAALEILQQEPTVDTGHIAAIGYCFGGGVLLELARRGLDIDAIASFHGSLGTNNPAQPGTVQTRIAVFNGAADPMAKPEMVVAFKEEMDKAGADYIFVDYPGVKHSFTNPEADKRAEEFGLPLAYDEAADKDSWEKMKAFFKETFSKK